MHERHPTGLWPRVGGRLFRRRSWLPLPLALLLIVIPAGQEATTAWSVLGLALIAAGETLRLWAVRHIGVISRTRTDRLGPVVTSGPFAYTRNPLYAGNIAIWTGFALAARLPWLALGVLAALALEYHAIVRWEEQLLTSRYGDEYGRYAGRVPRWGPRWHASRDVVGAPRYSWRETLFSERGTLAAIAAGCALLWVKGRP
jgi:protein-S-isoprenylcysteine O-methyltransferase Ste14